MADCMLHVYPDDFLQYEPLAADRITSHAPLLHEYEQADGICDAWQSFLSRAQECAAVNQTQESEAQGSKHRLHAQYPTDCDAALWRVPVKVVS